MVLLLYAVLYMAVLSISYMKFRKWMNIISAFTGMWFVFASVSSFGLFGLRMPRPAVHVYVCLFVLIVDAVILLFSASGRINIEIGRKTALVKTDRCSRLQLIVLILIIPILLKVISTFMSSGSLVVIRKLYFSGTLFESYFVDLIFRIVPVAILRALVIFYAYTAFETKRYKYLLFSLLNALLVTLINGGRYALLSLFYSILIMWLLGVTKFSTRGLGKRFGKMLRRIMLSVIFFMVGVTLIRGQELFRNIVIYFSGSLSFLDYILEYPEVFALDRPLYGYLSFAAIIEPFVLLFKVLGLTNIKVPSYEFNIYAQQYYDIGSGNNHIAFNANTSILYYFLRDFGSVGVIIGAFVFGGVTVAVYNKWQKGSRFCGLLFMYFMIALFNSIMTFELIGPTPIMIIGVFWLLTQDQMKLKRKRVVLKRRL